MGGLFGYSSENSITSLKVPANAHGEREKKSVCVKGAGAQVILREERRGEGSSWAQRVRETITFLKIQQDPLQRETNPSLRQRCRRCRIKAE